MTAINFETNPARLNDAMLTCILPREGRGIILIGGTKQLNNWVAEPYQEITHKLLQRAKPFAPDFQDREGNFRITSTQVGLKQACRGEHD